MGDVSHISDFFTVGEEINRIPDQLSFFCRFYWHDCSRAMRRKYSAHTANSRELIAESKKLVGVHGSLPKALEDADRLLKCVFDLSPLEYDELTTREMGYCLRIMSLASCQLGGRASYGDLEWYLQGVEEANFFDNEATRPRTLLKLFSEGHKQGLCLLLNHILDHVSKKLIARELTAPLSLWIKGEHGWYLNRPVFESAFPLVSSLLTYVEGEGGHA